jgi:SAM-dependent methyltransferase
VKPKDRLRAWLFHQICVGELANRPVLAGSVGMDPHDDYELASSQRFFARFSEALDVHGKSVLDVGCGLGETCVEAALRGATRVVGLDIRQSVIDRARDILAQTQPRLLPHITFMCTDGSLRELGAQDFDVVLSKDSFEHYAEPERSLAAMAGFVKPGGVVAIGFSPLWRSPWGGHIDYMTRLPWAHLLFPEPVIMAERRRFRPEEHAARFEDVSGGLNKMTLARFLRIVGASGMQVSYLATNVSSNPAVRILKAVSRIPALRELMTISVYTVLRPVSPPAAVAGVQGARAPRATGAPLPSPELPSAPTLEVRLKSALPASIAGLFG